MVELVDNCLYQQAAAAATGNLAEYNNVTTLDERLQTCLADLVKQQCLEPKKKKKKTTTTATATTTTVASLSSSLQDSGTTLSSSNRSFPKTTRDQGVFLDHIFQIMDL
jgi:hypothetical protein